MERLPESLQAARRGCLRPWWGNPAWVEYHLILAATLKCPLGPKETDLSDTTTVEWLLHLLPYQLMKSKEQGQRGTDDPYYPWTNPLGESSLTRHINLEARVKYLDLVVQPSGQHMYCR